jgi:uncharacterized protein
MRDAEHGGAPEEYGEEMELNMGMEYIIKVRVSAGAKTEKVEEVEPNVFKIRVSAPPEKGKANDRVAELLAEHFGVSKSKIFLVSGATYREKVFSVDK